MTDLDYMEQLLKRYRAEVEKPSDGYGAKFKAPLGSSGLVLS